MGIHQKQAVEAVLAERDRQDKKWGADGLEHIPVVAVVPFTQTPRGTKTYGIPSAKAARAREQKWRSENNESGMAALVEEVSEACEAAVSDSELAARGAEHGINEEASERELIQVTAYGLKMLEGIYARRAARAQRKKT